MSQASVTLDPTARTAASGGPPTHVARPRRSVRSQLGRVPLGLAIGLLLLIEVVPLVWLTLSSLKQDSEFSSRPVWALPQGLHWQNYVDAWTTGNMGNYFRNSIVATFPSPAGHSPAVAWPPRSGWRS